MLLFFPEKLFVAGKRDVRANSVHCGRRGVTAEGGSDGIFLYDTRRMPTFVLFPVYYKYFSYIHENTRVFIYSFTGYIYIYKKKQTNLFVLHYFLIPYRAFCPLCCCRSYWVSHEKAVAAAAAETLISLVETKP